MNERVYTEGQVQWMLNCMPVSPEERKYAIAAIRSAPEEKIFNEIAWARFATNAPLNETVSYTDGVDTRMERIAATAAKWADMMMVEQHKRRQGGGE